MTPKGNQYGSIGRVCGDSSRCNALKSGAQAADVKAALVYLRTLTAALDTLALPDAKQSSPLEPARPATATVEGGFAG